MADSPLWQVARKDDSGVYYFNAKFSDVNAAREYLDMVAAEAIGRAAELWIEKVSDTGA